MTLLPPCTKYVFLDKTPSLTKFLNGTLWTGDKKLLKCLKEKGFNNVITTSELLMMLSPYK